MGATVFVDCVFEDCTFIGIAVTGPKAQLDAFREAITEGS